ncbi:MAG: mandelate racemase [Acidiferrobacteraceae bacterium]|nr:mandelate racemase [Acidiferrobacteraceae bacterium]
MTDYYTIQKIDAFAVRVPIDKPVYTSFGTMSDRRTLLVRIEDRDGVVGWGEIWCNFPSDATEYRAKLLAKEIAPRLIDRVVNAPDEVFTSLTRDLEILANQSGEIGPFAQILAGIDIALWDISAKRARMPLWKFLGGQSKSVPIYASGFSPSDVTNLIPVAIDDGHIAFKIKAGFGIEADINTVALARKLLGPKAKLMVDVNQAWSLQDAITNIGIMSQFNLTWIEEPIRSNSSNTDWEVLAEASLVPLAAGENLNREHDFVNMIGSRTIRYIQPDIAKWGGVSGCSVIANKINQSGLCYCPHWLGGGVGLLASAHVLAANPGCGMLEVDINPNPMRELLLNSQISIVNSMLILSNVPGIGVEPPRDLLDRYLVRF